MVSVPHLFHENSKKAGKALEERAWQATV